MYPRGWPKPEVFQNYVSSLGISNEHHLILYDRSQFGFFASSRAWWTLRVFGHENVSILNGGLNAWLKNGNSLSNKKESFQVKINII